MSSREEIFNTLKVNKPALVNLPVIDLDSVISYDSFVGQFAETLTKIGGKVEFIASKEELKKIIEQDINSGQFIVDTIDIDEDKRKEINSLTSFDLAPVERAYINGTLGVSENGAVWVNENQMVNRLLPFICQHLVLVLNKRSFVPTMHHAYQQIDVGSFGFGGFIAGPSKTADIEQSLVIGAHGPRSLKVYIIEE